jgi:hypothetical protein
VLQYNSEAMPQLFRGFYRDQLHSKMYQAVMVLCYRYERYIIKTTHDCLHPCYEFQMYKFLATGVRSAVVAGRMLSYPYKLTPRRTTTLQTSLFHRYTPFAVEQTSAMTEMLTQSVGIRCLPLRRPSAVPPHQTQKVAHRRGGSGLLHPQ